MTTAKITRPSVIIKDYQGVPISSHPQEFQAITAAGDLPEGTYTIERPTVTIVVEES